MPGYVFVENSNKPTMEEAQSRKPVVLDNVSIPCLKAAKGLGYDVYMGVNRDHPETLDCNFPARLYDSHTYRSITALADNRIAYRNLDNLIKEHNIEVMHCNTPVGGMIGRIVGKKNKLKKIIYTAHGFHFYKGAPLLNRIVFKTAERIMAKWTDVIITMNEEDFQAAKKFKLRNGGKVYKVHGVGVNLDEFSFDLDNRKKKREELFIGEDDIVIISAGDLIKRKNYEIAIKAIAQCGNPNLHYFICGRGPEEENLKSLAENLNVMQQIHFLGFRTDVKELLNAADIFLFTTLQEGLPRSMMEAMACGLPCIASSIRGNVDLIEDGQNGYLCNPMDIESFASRLSMLSKDQLLRRKMGDNNLIRIKQYGVEQVSEEIQSIYSEVLS